MDTYTKTDSDYRERERALYPKEDQIISEANSSLEQRVEEVPLLPLVLTRVEELEPKALQPQEGVEVDFVEAWVVQGSF